jgi:hypothetical protein
VAAALGDTRLLFMQSNGGLVDARLFQGKDSILSGPAGGIVGAAATGASAVTGFLTGGKFGASCVAGADGTSAGSVAAGLAVDGLEAGVLAAGVSTAGAGGTDELPGGRVRSMTSWCTSALSADAGRALRGPVSKAGTTSTTSATSTVAPISRSFSCWSMRAFPSEYLEYRRPAS